MLLWLAFVITAGVVLAAAYPAISVGTNVLVSADRPNDNYHEVMIDADPANSNNLIACSQIYDETIQFTTFNYLSINGGKTWKLKLHVGSPHMSGDPACAFGLNSHIYVASLDHVSTAGGFSVSRSSNLGESWVTLEQGTFIDRPYFAIDRTGGQYNGRIYLNATGGHGGLGAMVFYSIDGGKTWSAPIFTVPFNTHLEAIGNSVVLSDGTLAFASVVSKFLQVEFAKDIPLLLKFITSIDGGRHLDTATVPVDLVLCGNAIPSVAADSTRGPFHDRLYIAYPEKRNGRCDIAFIRSADRGKTWSQPLIIDRDAALRAGGQGPDNYMPTVRVNNRGVVGIVWYDRRDDPQDVGRTVRFTASVDGGMTFAPSVPVSSATNKPSWNDHFGPPMMHEIQGNPNDGISVSAAPDVSEQAGDTGGLTADANGAFHALWPDDRTRVSQLWTARITVDGQAERNGDPALAALEDVTEKVSFRGSDFRYDPVGRTLSMNAILTNTSKTPLFGPIKARVVRLESRWASNISTSTTDNGQTKDGAVWDFTPAGDRRTLAPNAKTKPKHLIFLLREMKPISSALLNAQTDPRGLVDLQLRVLGASHRGSE